MASLLRVPALGQPLTGYFATKNVVYAMIARNLVEGHGSLAYPTLDCLVGGQRSWHLLECPVSAYLTALLWGSFGGSLDVWGRLTAAGFSVAAAGVLFAWARRRFGLRVALAASLALALAPVSVVVGQSFMLEPSLVFFVVSAFYALDRWLSAGGALWGAIFTLALAAALLTKVYMAVLLFPLGWELAAFARESPLRRRVLGAGAALFLATVPAAAWYHHAYTAAEPGSPGADRVYYSVRDSAAAHGLPHPLLRSPGFYARVLDELTGFVLAPLGFCLALVGLCHRQRRALLPWLAASGLLVLVLPRKFAEMPYYYLAILPPLCALVGLGWDELTRRVLPSRRATLGVLVVALLFSLRYSAGPAWTTPAFDRAVVEAGAAVQRMSEPAEPVATMHGTTLDLLYYCHRPGWALSDAEGIDQTPWAEYRNEGARWFVVAGTEADRFADRLPIAHRSDGFCIYRISDSP